MTQKELEKIILEEIESTNLSIDQFKEDTKPISPENAIGRISRMDAINNKSVSEAAMRTAQQKLKGLENALDKLKIGQFGNCSKCKSKIPIQRLLLVPQNPFCVNCAN